MASARAWAFAGLAPFGRCHAATHLVLADTSPDLPRDARTAGRGLIAQVGQSQATQVRGGGVTLSIPVIDSRLLVCAEAGSGGRKLGVRSSTTSPLGWSFAVLTAKTDVLIAISPFPVHDSLRACDRRGCGEAPASAGAGRRREAARPGRRRSAGAR